MRGREKLGRETEERSMGRYNIQMKRVGWSAEGYEDKIKTRTKKT